MGWVLDLASHQLDAPPGGLPVHIGNLLLWFLGSRVLEDTRETGSRRVDFAVKVRCINCCQRYMRGVKSQDAYGAKKKVSIWREVYLTAW